MTNNEKEKQYSREKWIHYQDVKLLNKKEELTEEEKKKVEDFKEFIQEEIKKEKDAQKK